ncbi:MAG: DUF3892 domain-containing protein [Oscillospiraceae bacterium]|nr:DUF3892 domain-containing protein [Oscillospiraceae bacterium]
MSNLKKILPLNAMSELPEPNADAKSITALKKSGGKIVGYQLEDGSLVNKSDAVNLARQGGIKGVGIAKNKGTEYLKSLPDENDKNNLSNLPTM